jgi:voltage-gated potassium channel
MEEVTIDGRSAIAGKSIRDSGLRERFGVVVVAIQREDQRMEFNPEADAPIRAGNKLVVLGRPDSLKLLEREASVQ